MVRPLSDERREEILERDNQECQYCGEEPPEPHVHHYQPRSEFDNGDLAHHRGNLVTLCGSHHRKLEIHDESFQRQLVREKKRERGELGVPGEISVLLTEEDDNPFAEGGEGITHELREADARYAVRHRLDELESDITTLAEQGERGLADEFVERFDTMSVLEREIQRLGQKIEETNQQLDEEDSE